MKTITNPAANDLAKSENPSLEDNFEKKAKSRRRFISRRSFLGTSLAAGAGTIGAGLLSGPGTASASAELSSGDAALLRFPAALETLEADFWIQYNELAGVQGSPVELDGYYRPDEARAVAAMRPSETLNQALASL